MKTETINPKGEAERSVFAEVKDLRGLRDELRLQAHLLKAETKDKLDELEPVWLQLEEKLGVLERESTVAAHSLAEASRTLIKDLREQYRRLKRD